MSAEVERPGRRSRRVLRNGVLIAGAVLLSACGDAAERYDGQGFSFGLPAGWEVAPAPAAQGGCGGAVARPKGVRPSQLTLVPQIEVQCQDPPDALDLPAQEQFRFQREILQSGSKRRLRDYSEGKIAVGDASARRFSVTYEWPPREPGQPDPQGRRPTMAEFVVVLAQRADGRMYRMDVQRPLDGPRYDPIAVAESLRLE